MLWQLHFGKEPWFAIQVTLVLLKVIAIHSWTNFLQQLWVWNLFYLLEFFLSAISLFCNRQWSTEGCWTTQGSLDFRWKSICFHLALHEQQLSWIAFLLGDNEKIVPKFLFRGDFIFLTLSLSLSLYFFYICCSGWMFPCLEG